MAKHTRRRMPKLSYTESQSIGYYASYRDPITNTPRRKRFGNVPVADAKIAYTRWLAEHMAGNGQAAKTKNRGPALTPLPSRPTSPRPPVHQPLSSGCLIAIADSLLRFEESRTRAEDETKSPSTIAYRVFLDRKKHLQDFLRHMTTRHGQGALARMVLADLVMEDVESYNQQIVRAGYSGSQVAKRMQIIKALINRAGRPEFGQQVLPWNWDAMDRQHGKATERRALPSLAQLKAILRATDARGQALIWMAIGLGFGQRDLAAVRVGQIDHEGYDLRRGKTGVERFGETPPMVWTAIQAYMQQHARDKGALLFTTRTGHPIVHGRSDSVVQWWGDLRKAIGETKQTLGGFYTLRHVGATEFGSRDGTSIIAMKRWLGHSASSSMADVYMKPVSPEQRELITWVRKSLATGQADLTTTERPKQPK